MSINIAQHDTMVSSSSSDTLSAAGSGTPSSCSSSDEEVCKYCGKPEGQTTLSKCGRCLTVKYCSKPCQQADWKASHKSECAQLATKRPGAGGGSSKAPEEDEVAPVPKEVICKYETFLKLLKDKSAISRPPVGLYNTGNSCFANSTLQCLLATRPLAAYLASDEHSYSCCKPTPSSWCLACELQTLAQEAKACPVGDAIAPRNITRNVRRFCNMTPGRQEDSHEFFVKVTEALESIQIAEAGGKARYSVRSQETTLLQHIFGGYQRNQTVCSDCGAASRSFQAFTSLELDLLGRVDSVESAVAHAFKDEWLDEDNKYKCEKCKSLVRACRRPRLETAPNCLALCLKRFGLGRYSKNNKKIYYDEHLDLTPHLADDAMDAGPATYSLYGVLVHLDAMNSTLFGHYVAFVKRGDGKWYLCDDDLVEEVPASKVLSMNAYMLFYQRHKPKPAPNPEYVRPASQAKAAPAPATPQPASPCAAAAHAPHPPSLDATTYPSGTVDTRAATPAGPSSSATPAQPQQPNALVSRSLPDDATGSPPAPVPAVASPPAAAPVAEAGTAASADHLPTCDFTLGAAAVSSASQANGTPHTSARAKKKAGKKAGNSNTSSPHVSSPAATTAAPVPASTAATLHPVTHPPAEASVTANVPPRASPIPASGSTAHVSQAPQPVQLPSSPAPSAAQQQAHAHADLHARMPLPQHTQAHGEGQARPSSQLHPSGSSTPAAADAVMQPAEASSRGGEVTPVVQQRSSQDTSSEVKLRIALPGVRTGREVHVQILGSVLTVHVPGRYKLEHQLDPGVTLMGDVAPRLRFHAASSTLSLRLPLAHVGDTSASTGPQTLHLYDTEGELSS